MYFVILAVLAGWQCFFVILAVLAGWQCILSFLSRIALRMSALFELKPLGLVSSELIKYG